MSGLLLLLLAVCHAEARLAKEDILKFKCTWNVFKQNIFVLVGITQNLLFIQESILEGDMGGSEYRNTADKIEQTPHHRKTYQHTDIARFTWSTCFSFFFKKQTSIPLLLLFRHDKHITRHSYRDLRV